MQTEWKNLPKRIDRAGTLLCRSAVDAGQGAVTFLGTASMYVLRILQVVATGPDYSMLVGRERHAEPVKYDHSSHGPKLFVGNIVLAEVSANRATHVWPVLPRVCKTFRRIADLGKFLGVDFFGGVRTDTAWDIGIADAFGDLVKITLRGFDCRGLLIFERTIDIDAFIRDDLPRPEATLDSGHVLFRRIGNDRPYGSLLRSSWSVPSSPNRADGFTFSMVDGETFLPNSALHTGLVSQIDRASGWIVIRDRAGFEVDAAIGHLPAPPYVGQPLKYATAHVRSGRIQARSIRVA